VKISNKKFSFFPSLNQYFPHIPYVASKNQVRRLLFLISTASLDFLKNFFHNVEKRLKILKTPRRNLILIRHLGLIHHIWPTSQNLTLGHAAGQNKNSLQKTERKNLFKFQNYAPIIFGRHLESDKKIIYKICPIKIRV
jgi:hypothetical protein